MLEHISCLIILNTLGYVRVYLRLSDDRVATGTPARTVNDETEVLQT